MPRAPAMKHVQQYKDIITDSKNIRNIISQQIKILQIKILDQELLSKNKSITFQSGMDIHGCILKFTFSNMSGLILDHPLIKLKTFFQPVLYSNLPSDWFCGKFQPVH